MEELSKPEMLNVNGGFSIKRVVGLLDRVEGNIEVYIFGRRII